MHLKRKEKAKKQVVQQVQEKGGVANIENPLTQVLEPAVEKSMPALHVMLKNIQNADKENDLPMRIPEKPTIQNVARRIYYEELMLAARGKYEELTGNDIQLDLSGGESL